jgi:hypothetical protein
MPFFVIKQVFRQKRALVLLVSGISIVVSIIPAFVEQGANFRSLSACPAGGMDTYESR